MPVEEENETVDVDQLNTIIEEEGSTVDDSEAEEAFLASYEGDDTKVVDDEPEEEEQEPEQEEVEEEPEADKEEEPEATKPAISAEDRMEAMEKRLRRSESRYGELNSKSKTQLAQIEALKKGREAPTEEQAKAAMEDGEKFKELARDFPEWAGATKEAMEFATREIRSSMPDIDALRKEMDDKLEFAEISRKLDKKHDGWENTINTEEFIKYAYDGVSDEDRDLYLDLKSKNDPRADEQFSYMLDSNPDWAESNGKLLASNDAKDVIKFLDEFKATQTPQDTGSSKKDRLRMNVAATNGSSKQSVKRNDSAEDAFIKACEGQ